MRGRSVRDGGSKHIGRESKKKRKRIGGRLQPNRNGIASFSVSVYVTEIFCHVLTLWPVSLTVT